MRVFGKTLNPEENKMPVNFWNQSKSWNPLFSTLWSLMWAPPPPLIPTTCKMGYYLLFFSRSKESLLREPFSSIRTWRLRVADAGQMVHLWTNDWIDEHCSANNKLPSFGIALAITTAITLFSLIFDVSITSSPAPPYFGLFFLRTFFLMLLWLLQLEPLLYFWARFCEFVDCWNHVSIFKTNILTDSFTVVIA